MECKDEACSQGWIPVTQVWQNVYKQSRQPDAAPGDLEVERKDMVRETVLTGLNHDEAWAHDPRHEMVYEVVKPCRTCKPGWRHPDLRPDPVDEAQEHGRRVKQIERAEHDQDWGPARAYKD